MGVRYGWVNRIAVQAHELLSLQRDHGVRPSVLVCELDFVDTRRPVLDHATLHEGSIRIDYWSCRRAKATLDTAVNTSPFLSNEERAKVMSLQSLRGPS